MMHGPFQRQLQILVLQGFTGSLAEGGGGRLQRFSPKKTGACVKN